MRVRRFRQWRSDKRRDDTDRRRSIKRTIGARPRLPRRRIPRPDHDPPLEAPRRPRARPGCRRPDAERAAPLVLPPHRDGDDDVLGVPPHGLGDRRPVHQRQQRVVTTRAEPLQTTREEPIGIALAHAWPPGDACYHPATSPSPGPRDAPKLPFGRRCRGGRAGPYAPLPKMCSTPRATTAARVVLLRFAKLSRRLSSDRSMLRLNFAAPWPTRGRPRLRSRFITRAWRASSSGSGGGSSPEAAAATC